MKTALYIGRFQPFHLGHHSVLVDLAEQGFDRIYIGIGSAQYSCSEDNPLTAQERRRCIKETVHYRPVAAQIAMIDIPDIHNDATWVDHVEKILYSVTTHYDVVVSGNDWVRRLFLAKQRPVQIIRPRLQISATQIRQWIRAHNSAWREFMAPACAAWIEPIIYNSHGPDRSQDQNSPTR